MIIYHNSAPLVRRLFKRVHDMDSDRLENMQERHGNLSVVGTSSRAAAVREPSCSNFSITEPYAEWLALAALAFRVPGRLDWDSKAMRFTNSAEATKLVRPTVRKGWDLTI